MVTEHLARAAVVALSWAARAQGDIIPEDFALAQSARFRRDAVRWWWGRRPAGNRSDAVCYIDSEVITSWSGTTRIPSYAVTQILAHRARHLYGAPPTQGNDAAGTLPAAVADAQEAQT